MNKAKIMYLLLRIKSIEKPNEIPIEIANITKHIINIILIKTRLNLPFEHFAESLNFNLFLLLCMT